MRLATAALFTEQKKQLNIWWQGTLFLTGLLAISVLLYLFDKRLLADELLWAKPIKFEVSVIIHFLTLSVLASILSPARQIGVAWKTMSYAVVAAGIFEVMYIFLQAARGRESHFNKSTVVESIMYGFMGIGAVILVLGSFYLGWLLYREYQSERNNPLFLSGALGLTAGSVLTLIIAGYMSSQPDNIIIASSDVIRVPLFGWYLNGQDLRVPHFLATHLMQLMPLYGVWLSQKEHASGGKHEAQLLWITGAASVLILVLFISSLVL